MTLIPGTIVAGSYEVIAVCARGGMGDVFSGVRLRDGRAVALKTTRPEARLLSEVTERFRREAVAVSAIRSDHVTELLDVIDDPSHGLIIVFELLEGETVEDALRREGVMDFERVHPMVSQMMRGLAAAHAVGVIHRDLKPANVFLTDDSVCKVRIKLLDFGVSKLPSTAGFETLTKVGQNIGSFFYMAPEQIDAPSSVDFRADLYACGGIIFKMLTGQPPFEVAGVAELIRLKRTAEARSLASVKPKHTPAFPAGVESFVATMLAREPSRRFTSTLAALDAWEKLAPGLRNREGRPAIP